jgi:hypothetical protein
VAFLELWHAAGRFIMPWIVRAALVRHRRCRRPERGRASSRSARVSDQAFRRASPKSEAKVASVLISRHAKRQQITLPSGGTRYSVGDPSHGRKKRRLTRSISGTVNGRPASN